MGVGKGVASTSEGQATVGVGLRFVFLLLLALGAVIFYPINRFVTEAGIPILPFIFWQCLGGAAMAAVALLFLKRRPPMSWRHIRFYLVSGSLSVCIPYIALLFAAPRVPVGILSLSLMLEPGFAYLFALVLLIERFRTLRFLGLFLGVAGLLLIAIPEASLPSPDMLPWAALGLVAPMAWAAWGSWNAIRRPPAVDSVSLTFGMLLFAALLMLPVMAATGEWWWFEGDFLRIDWTVVTLMAGNAFFWYVGFECVRLAGPVFFACWAFIGTPMVLAAGIVIFDERHSLWVWSALVLLLAGLYLVNRTMPARVGKGTAGTSQ
ncbi:MAG: DMT family transporter [Proteobacteria bacterium]|nr:DMT family transporter [Pseudomonadota bacterium]